jgi:hypothetical protein
MMTEIVTGKQVLEEERDTWKARAEAAERRVAELEALLAGWVALKRGAIERREDIPWQALLVEFREPTAAERAYGETLISLLPPPTGENDTMPVTTGEE